MMDKIIITMDWEQLDDLKYNMGITLEKNGVKDSKTRELCIETLLKDIKASGIEIID